MTKAIDLCQTMNQGLSSLRLSPEARQQVRSRAYGRARNRPKVYDAKEQDWAFDDERYVSILPEVCRWANWAHDDKSGSAMTGDKLLGFVNNTLFPVLKGKDVKDASGKTLVEGIRVTAQTPIKKAIVQTVFADANQYMTSTSSTSWI